MIKSVGSFKKKYAFAFTLAEVLIVLGVIGIVAQVTIPTLVKDYQKVAYGSQFKKMYATYETVTREIAQNNGGSCAGLSFDDYFKELQKYLKISKSCTSSSSGCWPPINGWYSSNGAVHSWASSNPEKSLILSDGAMIGIYSWIPSCAFTGWGTRNGKGICGEAIIDTNGLKGPNKEDKDIFFVLPQDDSLWVLSSTTRDILVGK